jgi:predicted alpha/beta-hydrolase family hydrolase
MSDPGRDTRFLLEPPGEGTQGPKARAAREGARRFGRRTCSPLTEQEGAFEGLLFVLWHGAGGDVEERSLVALARALRAEGAHVARARFAYRRAGRRFPDRMPALLEDARQTIALIEAELPRPPRARILGGRSMGGRVASMLAAEGDRVDGLVFLGYPLHPEGKPEQLRDEHLYRLAVPMLFIQGDRDALAELSRLRPVLDRLGARATLALFEGADHSLKKAPLDALVDRTRAWALERF